MNWCKFINSIFSTAQRSQPPLSGKHVSTVWSQEDTPRHSSFPSQRIAELRNAAEEAAYVIPADLEKLLDSLTNSFREDLFAIAARRLHEGIQINCTLNVLRLLFHFSGNLVSYTFYSASGCYVHQRQVASFSGPEKIGVYWAYLARTVGIADEASFADLMCCLICADKKGQFFRVPIVNAKSNFMGDKIEFLSSDVSHLKDGLEFVSQMVWDFSSDDAAEGDLYAWAKSVAATADGKALFQQYPPGQAYR